MVSKLYKSSPIAPFEGGHSKSKLCIDQKVKGS